MTTKSLATLLRARYPVDILSPAKVAGLPFQAEELRAYEMHSSHGAAPAIATGLAVTRPDLSGWAITGVGDALSIGGDQLIHLLRRDVNLKILLLTSRVSGLAKGRYSPTSEQGEAAKSGSADHPLNAVSLALRAGVTFVARALDTDRRRLADVLGAAAEHRGTALVEIYQNRPVCTDDALKEPGERRQQIIPLRHGEPVRFGARNEYGVIRDPATGSLRVAKVSEVGEASLLIHYQTLPDPSQALALSRLDGQRLDHVPVGIFRAVRRSTCKACVELGEAAADGVV